MPVGLLQDQLNLVNKVFRPILKFVVPNLNLTKTKKLSFINLIVFSLTIPFVLGLDDFAGYIPLFTLVNVFGFTLGILLGHMLLTIGLFAFPKKTVEVVKHPIVLVVGGVAFLGLGIYGFWEALQIFLAWIH
jgi:asparagine N-glycosylation enzyme membrane subunit Stt3